MLSSAALLRPPHVTASILGLPQPTHPVLPRWHLSLRLRRQFPPTRPHVSCRGGQTSTALGAAQQQHGRARGRQRRSSLQARFFLSQRQLRQRRPSSLAPACLYAGLFAVAALLSYPAATSAAGSAAKAGAKAAESVNLVAHVDKAFWAFAENLRRLLSLEAVDPIAQCSVMFYTAWITNCIGPVPAAGVIQQPLGRAMLATASSHACYAACSFLAAAFALSTFPPLFMTPTRGVGGDSGSPGLGPKTTPKPIGARNNRQRGRRPSLKLPSPLLPSKRRGPAASAPTGPPVTRIQVRRSARSVPKVWLMAATALGGPAMGAVGAAVSWKAGLVAIPAALSSLSRGAAFSVLVAGTLCYGGAGTAFVARWAVFQGVVGGLFAAMLTPSALTVVYMCNYYGRMVTDRRRRGPGPPRGGMRGGRGPAGGLGAKREGPGADGKGPDKRKEGGSADSEDKNMEKDK